MYIRKTLTLCIVFVRPKFVDRVQLDSSHLESDSELSEKVERTATKLLPGIAMLPYDN